MRRRLSNQTKDASEQISQMLVVFDPCTVSLWIPQVRFFDVFVPYSIFALGGGLDHSRFEVAHFACSLERCVGTGLSPVRQTQSSD